MSSRGGRGGGRGGAKPNTNATSNSTSAGAAAASASAEKAKKPPILDLAKYLNKAINVKFNGGREVTGLLKGYDQLMNLVLDEGKEVMRDDENNESTRPLGLLVARGTLLVMISPVDGSEEIANPFVQPSEEAPVI